MGEPEEYSRQFHVVCIFCLHRAHDKIQTWKLFARGKPFLMDKIHNSKLERCPRVKKKTKQAQRGEKWQHYVKKQKKQNETKRNNINKKKSMFKATKALGLARSLRQARHPLKIGSI